MFVKVAYIFGATLCMMTWNHRTAPRYLINCCTVHCVFRVYSEAVIFCCANWYSTAVVLLNSLDDCYFEMRWEVYVLTGSYSEFRVSQKPEKISQIVNKHVKTCEWSAWILKIRFECYSNIIFIIIRSLVLNILFVT